MATARVPTPGRPAAGARAVLAAQGVLSLLVVPLIAWTEIPVVPSWLDGHRGAGALVALVVGAGVLALRPHLGAERSPAWIAAMVLEVVALGVAGGAMVHEASLQIGLGAVLATGAVWQLLSNPGSAPTHTRAPRPDRFAGGRPGAAMSIDRGKDRKGLMEPASVPSEQSTDSLSAAGGRLGAMLHSVEAVADWLGRPSVPARAVVPDFRGMCASETSLPALRAGVRIEISRLTEHPAPTDGVVVDQDPAAGATVKRDARVTLIVRHPQRIDGVGRS